MTRVAAPVLALHAEDIVAIGAVILVWVALRRLGGRGRRNRPPVDDATSRLDGDG